MTKAEIVNNIVKNTGIDKKTALTAVEAVMEEIRQSMINGENVYLRGIGTFFYKVCYMSKLEQICQFWKISSISHKFR